MRTPAFEILLSRIGETVEVRVNVGDGIAHSCPAIFGADINGHCSGEFGADRGVSLPGCILGWAPVYESAVTLH